MATCKQPNPLSIVLDFDGTITTKDTITTLFTFALSRQKSKSKTDYTSVYNNDILAKYAQDYTSHIRTYTTPAPSRRTLEQEIAFQRSLGDVEVRSFARVSQSGIFRGIAPGEWEEAGREAVRAGRSRDHGEDVVVIRPGFGDLVRKVEEDGGDGARWGIVSVNFSEEFVRGVVSAALGDGEENGSSSREVDILANCAEEDGCIRGPGISDSPDGRGSVVTTSGDKLAVMRKLLDKWEAQSGVSRDRMTVVYFGDSGTDIECLTENGVAGVVISDGESKLLETMERIGIQVDHVKTYSSKDDAKERVYWARDFTEFIESPLFQKR
ncbi:hypothetical protein F5884DRAFT_665032 [Xylogone sp. PMI_703]|nr:hypothetical protein F5884DRAFT_665032 [Xylogone sp. PMI_703]